MLLLALPASVAAQSSGPAPSSSTQPAPARVPVRPSTPFDVVATAGPDCGRRIQLSRSGITVGRGDVDLSLHDDTLSRRHARISVESGHDIAVEARHRVMQLHRVLNLMTHVDPWHRPDRDHEPLTASVNG